MTPYHYTSQGRSSRAILVLAAIYAVLISAYLALDAAWWILAIVAVCTLPALWDIASNRQAGLEISESHLTWHAGPHGEAIALNEIDKIRLDTRLDMSVRATVIKHSGVKRRLPYEATPPHQAFEAELKARAIKSERHHFSLMS